MFIISAMAVGCWLKSVSTISRTIRFVYSVRLLLNSVLAYSHRQGGHQLLSITHLLYINIHAADSLSPLSLLSALNGRADVFWVLVSCGGHCRVDCHFLSPTHCCPISHASINSRTRWPFITGCQLMNRCQHSAGCTMVVHQSPHLILTKLSISWSTNSRQPLSLLTALPHS